MSIFSVPSQNSIQKQLDATLSAGATSLTLSEDVSSLVSASATNPGVLVIDRVDSSGNATPSKREYITFTGVSSATLSGLTRNADSSGSDQEHAVGAIVEFVPDVLWAQSIQDTFETQHGADGTHAVVTATSVDIGSTVVVTGVLDEDDMASDSDVKLATQQSIKAYVDSVGTDITALKNGTVIFIIDGGGAAITTGIKGDIVIPFACTITQNTALADQSGSIVVDVWKDTYANFPPTDADSITASAPITITTATNSQDSTLTGWTTSISAGDILRFNVDSVTDIERVTLSLDITRS